MLTKSYLQLAASYSQFNDHRRALFYGKKCLSFLNSISKNIENLLTRRSILGLKFKDNKNIRKKINS